MTIFFWGIKAREWIWELLEELSGARLTHTYVRVGGVAYDLTPDFAEKVLALFPKIDAGPQGHRRTRSTRTASSATAWTASASSPQEHALSLRLDRPDAALDGRRLRRAQGAPVPRLRSLRLRRAGRLEGRQLRSLHRAHRRDRGSRCASSSRRFEQIPAGPGGASTIRASSCRPSRRSTTPSKAMICALQDHRRRHQGAAGRGLLVHRRRQRRARLLHRLRRHRPTLQVPRAPAVLHHHQRAVRDDRQQTASPTSCRPST